VKILINYACSSCGVETERYTIPEEECNPCECGGMAYKVLSAPRFLKIDGFPSGIEGAAWAKVREANSKRKNAA